MSIAKAKTNPYGPGTIDIQIEQGADFLLPMHLSRGSSDWNLSLCVIEAHFSSAWSPGGVCIPLTIVPGTLSGGTFGVRFPSASSLALVLPSPSRKTYSPEKFQLGGWILNITDPSITDAPTKRVCEGSVFLDRDPCLT